MSQYACAAFLCMFTLAMLPSAARADIFAKVYYDAREDQVVVTLNYRGTNPDHRFTLKWGRCKQVGDGGKHQIVAQVIDDQWQDVEKDDYQKTTRFSVANLSCRPAKLTLRTAPRFYYTLEIPARPAPAP